MKTWQDHWEEHAGMERRLMESLTVEELLRNVGEGRFGAYFTLWEVLAERATPEEAGWVLFRVLEGDADYLHRYACAAALLRLMEETGLKPVDLSAPHPDLEENLGKVRRTLRERLGEPRD